MTSKAILVTGANGEIGRGIIDRVSQESSAVVVAVDLNPPTDYAGKNVRWVKGDILDAGMFGELSRKRPESGHWHHRTLCQLRLGIHGGPS